MTPRENPVEPGDDETVVVAAAQTPADETVVVANPRAEDATIAVPREAPADATVVVARERGDASRRGEDQTVVVARPAGTAAPTRGATTGTPAPPVEEPEEQRSASDIAARFFKPPLDARRRAPAAPFPQRRGTEPRPGLQQGLPVVSGPRQPERRPPEGVASLQARLGAVPETGVVPPPAERESLPSTARQNRRFRWLAWGGGVAVLVIAGLGFWGIAELAFG